MYLYLIPVSYYNLIIYVKVSLTNVNKNLCKKHTNNKKVKLQAILPGKKLKD